ncbi:MAG: TonB family protein [Pyrinomonadaceae bacterium]
MPSNVGRLSSVFLVLSAFTAAAAAQSPQSSQSPSAPATGVTPAAVSKAPTTAEVMRDRISKAKAFIAVRNYSAAIYELENIRRETGDPSVHAVANVLLMNSYLEQGDHKRAQAFLNQFYNEQKTTKPGAFTAYTTIAGQIVKSARSQAERYRSLGLNIGDRELPLEALNDLEKMRETVEIVITQSKELSNDKTKTAEALGLLEEATNSRVMIARDDYDARRWRDLVADSREAMASSRSVVINAVDGTSSEPAAAAAGPGTVAGSNLNKETVGDRAVAKLSIPVDESKPAVTAAAKPVEPLKISAEKPPIQKISEDVPDTAVERSRIVAGTTRTPNEDSNKVKATLSSTPVGPLFVGSLLPYASKQSQPRYPAAARSIRATGVVKVEVTVDEEGNVSEVKDTSGPALLQSSAKEAILKWKFRPFVVDGQPVKATGFVNFNFSL